MSVTVRFRMPDAKSLGGRLKKARRRAKVLAPGFKRAMVRVREAFAPENRLNPGKIFPDGTHYQPPARRPEPGLSI